MSSMPISNTNCGIVDNFNCNFAYPAPYAAFHHTINSFGGHRSHATLETSKEHRITDSVRQRATSNEWRETADAYVLKVDLSRFKKEDIKLKMENEGLKIINSDGFSRTVPFPELSDAGFATAKLENGVLNVRAPKKESIK